MEKYCKGDISLYLCEGRFMEYVYVVIVVCVLVAIIWSIFGYNVNKLKQIAVDVTLDEIIAKYPNNTAVGRTILEKLGNSKVVIEEMEDTKSSIYMVAINKIIIGNLGDSYARIQVVAHECLHSIQSKKVLWFNFIFSNMYNVYFGIITILACCNKLVDEKIFFVILVVFASVQILVKNYLETDAMIKARYVSKDYLKDVGVATEDEVQKVIDKYDIINDIGIKLVNIKPFLNCMMHIVVFSLVCFLI